MKPFISLLFALYGLPSAIAAFDADTSCRARAWVRAPDLEPGKVVQGDVRVKLNGSCDGVSSYNLGLRFAERSWVKTRREGIQLPERPKPSDGAWKGRWAAASQSNNSIYETDSFLWGGFSDGIEPSTWEKYESDIKDPALWLVREEERIGFETKYAFRNERVSDDVVETFAILVPYTNYPPAFDRSLSSSAGGDADIADAEHIYEYFVDVTFANGTQRQISAGYTSFNAVTSWGLSGAETINVTVPRSKQVSKFEMEDAMPRDDFTLEVTFPHGRHVEEGSAHNITIISHQLGPGLQRALSLQYLDINIRQKRRWAAGLAADNETAETLLSAGSEYTHQLQPKADDDFVKRRRYSWENGFELPQFSQDGVIENGTAFSTDAVTAHFDVPVQCYPHFEMYYQTSEVELMLNLAVRNVSSDDARSYPFDATVHMSDDEYDWTPVLPRKESYPPAEILQARIPLFVRRKIGVEDGATHEMTHYLSPEARAPTFVDPSSVSELLQRTARERDNLTPIAKAKFVTPADGNVVKNRYYGGHRWRAVSEEMYYVGDTWLRKVVKGGSREPVKKGETLVIQT